MPYLDKKYNYGRGSRSHNLREAGLFVGFSMLAIMLTLFVLGWIAYVFETPTAQAASGINKKLHYQGKLNNSAGVAVADDTYNIKLVIYDASSDGNCLRTIVDVGQGWQNKKSKLEKIW